MLGADNSKHAINLIKTKGPLHYFMEKEKNFLKIRDSLAKKQLGHDEEESK